MSYFVTKEEMHKHVRISSDLEKHIEWLKGDIKLGFAEIYLHNAIREHEKFVDSFGSKVLPALLE